MQFPHTVHQIDFRASARAFRCPTATRSKVEKLHQRLPERVRERSQRPLPESSPD